MIDAVFGCEVEDVAVVVNDVDCAELLLAERVDDTTELLLRL